MHQEASSLLSKNQTIVFMGSPLFAIPSLELMHQEFGKKLVVITQPDRPKGRKQLVQATPVKKACENLGIEVFMPKNKLELLQLLETLNPVLIQVVAYGMILPDDVIKRWLCLNVHPSLLPKYRGASPIQSAILSGENKTGCSIIKLVKEMDAGPIVSQQSYIIDEEEDAQSLEESLSHIGATMLLEVCLSYLKDQQSLKFQDQDESKASECQLIKTSDAQLFESDSSKTKLLKIRAFNKKPGAFILLEGKRIKIIKAKRNQGEIIPVLVQQEGKQIVSYKDFCLSGKKIVL